MTDAQQAWDSGNMGLNPGEDARRCARELLALYRRYPEDPDIAKMLTLIANVRGKGRDGTEESGEEASLPYELVPISEVSDELPRPILSPTGSTGVSLAEGRELILASEGGSGKTSFMGQVALGIAARPTGSYGRLPCGFMDGRGGKVVILSYEDPAPIIKQKIVALAGIYQLHGMWNPDEFLPVEDALQRILVISEKEGEPQEMFGQDTAVHIETKPKKLQGWHRLWSAINDEEVVLLIIDPAFAAYTGSPLNQSHVRSYLSMLRAECRPRRMATLVALHSTKEVRATDDDEVDESILFAPTQVMGSGAWHDAARAVMTMMGRGEQGKRRIAVMKANWGKARILIETTPWNLEAPRTIWDRMIVGFHAVSGWRPPRSKKKGKSGRQEGQDNAQSNGVAHEEEFAEWSEDVI